MLPTPAAPLATGSSADGKSDEQPQPTPPPPPPPPRVSKPLSRLASSPLPPEFVPGSLSLHAPPPAAAAIAAAAPAAASHPLPDADALSPVVVRLLLGRKAAACIIGRHGECVTALRASAAAALYECAGPAARCSQPFLFELDAVRPGHTQRIAAVSGALVQVQRALEGAVNLMAEKRAIGAAAAAATVAAAATPACDPSQTSASPPLPPPPPPRAPRRPPLPQASDQVALRLIVPNSQLGAVMGVGGSTLAELRRQTAAAIRVSSENLPASQEKSLLVNGTRTAVHHAVALVVELLCRAQLAGASFPTSPYVVRDATSEQAPSPSSPAPPSQTHPPAAAAAAAAVSASRPGRGAVPATTNAAPLQMMAGPPMPMPMPMAMSMAGPQQAAAFSLPMQMQGQFIPLAAQLHEVTMRLQQLGIQAAHHSLYGALPAQMHAVQMEMQQLQHIYQMLQAQLAQHQQQQQHQHQQHSLSLAPPPQAAMPVQQQQQQQQQPPMSQSLLPPPSAASGLGAGSDSGAVHASRRAALKALSVNRVKHSLRSPLTLHIPSSLVGGVIGKKGHRINEVRAQSGASIKIESRAAIASAPVAPLAAAAATAAAVLATRPPQPAPAAAANEEDDGGDRKESEWSGPVGATAATAGTAASVPAPVVQPADRTLTLSGTRIQVETAAQLIAQLIETQASRQQQQQPTSTNQ